MAVPQEPIPAAVVADTSVSDDTESGPNRVDLAEAAVSGARSFAYSRFVIEIILFTSTLAIARLVGPAQQGRAAIALVFPVVATIFTFEGFGSALVASQSPTRDDYRTAMTMSLITGLVLAILVAGGAETIGKAVFGVATANLITLTSPTFVIASTTCVSRAQLMRNLGFGRMSRNDVVATIFGTGSVVGLAALGLGARALILGAVIASVVDMLLQFQYARPVLPGWSAESSRRILAFGSYASLFGVLSTLFNNIDYLILGVTLPARLVGIYYRSYAFGVQYQGKITAVVMRMIFPLMARAEDPAEMRRLRERTVEFNAMTALPFLGLVVALAPSMVPILYGSRWRGAIEPTQILAVAGMATAINSGATGAALALGRTRLLAIVTALSVAFYGLTILIASPYGLITVCIASAGAHVILMLANQRYLIDKVIDLPATQILIDTGPALAATAISTGATAAVDRLVGGLLPALVAVAVSGLFGLFVYGASMRLLFPRRFERLDGLIRRVMRRAEPAKSDVTAG